MKILGTIVVVAACHAAPAGVANDASEADELRGLVPGPHDHAGFSLALGDPARAIAEGAKTFLWGRVRSSQPVGVTATTDDPSVLVPTFSPSADDPSVFTIELVAPAAGDTDIVVRDATASEIDRITLHVRPTDELATERPWGTGAALVLADESQLVHVTTKTAGAVTVGTGAVSFVLSGALTPSSYVDAPWFFGEGDHVRFRMGATTGTIVATAPTATQTIDLTAVEPAALSGITRSSSSITLGRNVHGEIAIGATAAGHPVYGVRCTWSVEPGLTIELANTISSGDQTGWVGSAPSFVYRFSASSAGTFMPVCTLPGGLTTVVAIHVTN